MPAPGNQLSFVNEAADVACFIWKMIKYVALAQLPRPSMLSLYMEVHFFKDMTNFIAQCCLLRSQLPAGE
jgi:hypothetical protein